jgi:FkbM family methyltransferase
LKKIIQAILQRTLGFGNYLFVFAIYKSLTIKSDSKEGDFKYLLQLISSTDNVLDIGANIGIMTSNLSKKVKQGKVFSFEPMPDNISTLKKIIRFFKLNNVKLFEVALGNENKDIEMVLPVVSAVKMQGLAHVVDDSITEFNDGIRFKVKQYRLDDFEELKTVPIKAIKIDVENFEYQVFCGAKNLIINNQPIIYCELWDNENRYNCFNFFDEIGFEIKILVKEKLEIFDSKKHQSQNFFFIPK